MWTLRPILTPTPLPEIRLKASILVWSPIEIPAGLMRMTERSIAMASPTWARPIARSSARLRKRLIRWSLTNFRRKPTTGSSAGFALGGGAWKSFVGHFCFAKRLPTIRTKFPIRLEIQQHAQSIFGHRTPVKFVGAVCRTRKLLWRAGLTACVVLWGPAVTTAVCIAAQHAGCGTVNYPWEFFGRL